VGERLQVGVEPMMNRFSRYPYTPVISALGTRVVLAMIPPHVVAVDMKTPPTPAV
jgi:hypothetical protein